MVSLMDRINVDGVNLEVKHFGREREADATIVFLHHGLGSAGQWRDFPDRLAQQTGYRAMAFSRRGFAGSDWADWPRELNFLEIEALDVLPKVLDALDIEQAIFVGHSEGGSMGLMFAANHPDRTKAVITEAAHLWVEPTKLVSIANMRHLYETTALREKLKRHHGENVDSAFYGWCESWLQPGFEKWEIRDTVAKVRCPVLAIHGIHDEYVALETFEEIVRILGDHAEPMRLDCGHMPHEEMREEVLARMTAFIARL